MYGISWGWFTIAVPTLYIISFFNIQRYTIVKIPTFYIGDGLLSVDMIFFGIYFFLISRDIHVRPWALDISTSRMVLDKLDSADPS